ncbi:MAG TPA: GNAT family N-acetyltransferase [Gaiellaceae bacterium]|nr:GNAT family N-acetyltransferase [Gaiellaceae bacterium]
MTRIVTERLVLRVPTRDDDLSEFVADDDVQVWVDGLGEDPADVIERWVRRWERDGIGPFAVELDGRLIGRVGFSVRDSRTWETSSFELAGEHVEVELGWAILSEHWGRGYATEAARAARAWLGRERLISMINPENGRSIRVAEKLGARRTERVETPHGPAEVWVHPA